MGIKPRRWRFLRTKNWYHHQRRSSPFIPMRHDPTRLPAAGTLQSQISFRWRGGDGPTSHHSPCHPRQSGALHCYHHWTFCWKMVCVRVLWGPKIIILFCLLIFWNHELIILFFFSDRPFWISPRQVLVIPVAAPYVSWPLLFFQNFFGGGLCWLILCSRFCVKTERLRSGNHWPSQCPWPFRRCG